MFKTRPVSDVVRLLVVTPLALLGLAACETTQTSNSPNQPGSIGSDPGTQSESAGFTIVHEDWRHIGYRWDWTGHPTLTSREDIKFCQPYDDVVVIQGTGNSLSVLDTVTGRIRWSDRPSNPLARFVGCERDGQTLYVCSESEVFLMDISTGNWLDRQPMSVVVNTRPLLFGKTLIFGTPTGDLFSHRTDFGVTAWRYNVGGPIQANPVFVGSLVGAVAQNGQVLFLDPASAIGMGRPRVGGPLETNPVSDGSLLYVACMDQSVYAFEPDSPRHRWRYRTNEELDIQPTYHAGVLYVTVPGTGLVALDASRGSENWIGPEAGGEVIAMTRGALIVWDGEMIKAVEPTNGDVLHAFATPGILDIVADRFDDGNLYAVTRGDGVIRFRPR
ncbi:MAG: hypothetical protein D6695_00625 [Planctomycetota bacterium]|nr:MAG: hypothetical protein D6695_00625 [Planctomycetota bacterium]